jgi:hypothetical protein
MATNKQNNRVHNSLPIPNSESQFTPFTPLSSELDNRSDDDSSHVSNSKDEEKDRAHTSFLPVTHASSYNSMHSLTWSTKIDQPS